MRPVEEFRGQPPEFWALVKLASQVLGYSERGTGRIRRYDAQAVDAALRKVGLQPRGHHQRLERVAAYVGVRADLLEQVVAPSLMDREEAAALFERVRRRVSPPEALLAMNKQSKEKRHYAYLAGIVNMLTYETLVERFDEARFAQPASPADVCSRWNAPADAVSPDGRSVP